MTEKRLLDGGRGVIGSSARGGRPQSAGITVRKAPPRRTASTSGSYAAVAAGWSSGGGPNPCTGGPNIGRCRVGVAVPSSPSKVAPLLPNRGVERARAGTRLPGHGGAEDDELVTTDAAPTQPPAHRADMFLDPESDPREGGTQLGDERATLVEFLRCQRLTLQVKCEGLDAEQLARRSVEPSTMSLLGLLRHMAEVERSWFRRRFAGQDVPKRYQSAEQPDGDFDGAVADPAVVAEAWAAWREEVAFAEEFTAATDLDFVAKDGAGEPLSLRELLVHMVEEYARHNGHADLLRERIDGRVGE
jgi:uncharacterized damage-inducible protein DinB